MLSSQNNYDNTTILQLILKYIWVFDFYDLNVLCTTIFALKHNLKQPITVEKCCI